jgi:hypothetical protein
MPLLNTFSGSSWAGARVSDGPIYAASVSQADVQAALNLAVAGDTVIIPAGSATWCTAGAIGVPTGVKLFGSGIDVTVINVSINCGSYTSGMIYVNTNATFGYATINGQGSNRTTFVGNGNGFRVTNIKYNGTAGEGYFLYGNGAYGLLDNCIINGGAGNTELIFTRGPGNAWQTPPTFGTDQAVYVEDCVFGGSGYVSDFNSNAKGVVRFCTITAVNKIDTHGIASNTPPRSGRHTEIYRNNFTSNYNYATRIEMRGGSGIIFDNAMPNVIGPFGWFFLRDYAYETSWPNFGNVVQTLYNYPVGDQIGTGQDITIDATAIPPGRMVRIATVGNTNYTTIGAANNNIGTQFVATGPASGTGTVTTTPAATEPFYLINNTAALYNGSTDWTLTFRPVPQTAIDLYRTQTGNPSATYNMGDVIMADRDYFKQTVGTVFNGSSGVGRGTKSQMLAITPSKTGVGFWVTDEGTWNKTPGGEQGQLYTWSGSAWNLYYTPYTYPHPLRG